MATHVLIIVHHYVAIVEMGIVNNNVAASLATMKSIINVCSYVNI